MSFSQLSRSRMSLLQFNNDELLSVASSLQSSNSTARAYQNLTKISEGGFSTVYRAQKVEKAERKTLVAIKKIRVSNWKRKFLPKFMKSSKTVDTEKNGMSIDEVLEEVNMLRHVQGHEFILNFFDSFKSKGEYWVVTEVTLGDLHTIMKESKVLPVTERRKTHFPLQIIMHLISPIFNALSHCHKVGIVHRDIKEDNILLTNKGVPKLCDFGSAKPFKQDNLPLTFTKKGPIGSFFYMAPEILRGESYFPSVDTWSLGVTILAMHFGEQPFCQVVPFNLMRLQEFLVTKCFELDKAHAKNPKRISAQDRFYKIASILNENSDGDSQQWKDVVDICRKALILDKDNRASVIGLCENEPWLKEQIAMWNSFVQNLNNDEEKESSETQESEKVEVNDSFLQSHRFVMQLVQEAELKYV